MKLEASRTLMALSSKERERRSERDARPSMATAEMSPRPSRRRQLRNSGTVVGAGDGGRGLIVLGGALAATAALGVAFVFRAASRKKATTTKGSPLQAEEEKKRRTSPCSRECGGKEVEDREGLRSLAPTRPTPLHGGGESTVFEREDAPIDRKPRSASESSDGDSSSMVVHQESVDRISEFAEAQEKTADGRSSIGGGQESKSEETSIQHNRAAGVAGEDHSFSTRGDEDLVAGRSNFVPGKENTSESKSSVRRISEENGVLFFEKKDESLLNFVEEDDSSTKHEYSPANQKPSSLVSESGASDENASHEEISDLVRVQQEIIQESSHIASGNEARENLSLVHSDQEEEEQEDPSDFVGRVENPATASEFTTPEDPSRAVNQDVVAEEMPNFVPDEKMLTKNGEDDDSQAQNEQEEQDSSLPVAADEEDEGGDDSGERAPFDPKNPAAVSDSYPGRVMNTDTVGGSFGFAPSQSGPEEREDSELFIFNKDVVVDETKVIEVVDEDYEPEETASSDQYSSEEEDDEGGEERGLGGGGGGESPAEESSCGEADPAAAVWPLEATESVDKPVLGLIRRSKPKPAAATKKNTGGKVGAEEAAEMRWEEERVRVPETMAVATKEKGLSRSAQVLVLLSTLLFTTMLAFWLHLYSSKVVEQSRA